MSAEDAEMEEEREPSLDESDDENHVEEEGVEEEREKEQKEQEEQGEETEAQEEESEEPTKEQLKEEIDELESSLKKVMADFDNYRKRMVKEKSRIREKAAEDLMTDLLEIIDDFERALENGDELERDGVEMIYRKFRSTLEKHGLEEIETEDEKFDPMYHECVQSVEKEDVESDKIIEEYQKGYKLNDNVIRPSRVKVCR